jgi:2Fe-2S iron-sulfur cluster binding domain/Molybdopterin-binding domain of aldehyde dehydrogenase
MTMSTIRLKVNGKAQSVQADPTTPLLWLLRDHLGLTGTKFGCGIAQCGACTVNLNGAATFPVNTLNGAWRGPCYNSHAFNVETFIDECAVAAGIDPLDFRLKLLAKWDKSWSDCLQLAAEKSGRGIPLPKSGWQSSAKRLQVRFSLHLVMPFSRQPASGFAKRRFANTISIGPDRSF